MEEKFVALIIDPKFLKAKITFTEQNDIVYHHIWGALPKESFKIIKVARDGSGRFIL